MVKTAPCIPMSHFSNFPHSCQSTFAKAVVSQFFYFAIPNLRRVFAPIKLCKI